MTPQLSRNVADLGSIRLVSLEGELDMATAVGLVDWLTGLSASTLVVDLSELTFMDSSGISAMVQVKKQLGDAFVLTRPRSNVRLVFEVTGLADWFTEWDPAWSPESA